MDSERETNDGRMRNQWNGNAKAAPGEIENSGMEFNGWWPLKKGLVVSKAENSGR